MHIELLAKTEILIQFSSVQSLIMSDSATPWIAAHQTSLCVTNSHQTDVHSIGDAIQSHPSSSNLILYRSLLLLPSIFPSIRVFSNGSALHIRWPKYWSFSFSISPSNEYSGWISLKTDWLDLCTVQGTLKSLLRHHSSKASIFWCSAFFMVQHSHPYMITGKTIALTRQCRRPGFEPWVGKIPWRRKWQPTPVLLPGKSIALTTQSDISAV